MGDATTAVIFFNGCTALASFWLNVVKLWFSLESHAMPTSLFNLLVMYEITLYLIK